MAVLTTLDTLSSSGSFIGTATTTNGVLKNITAVWEFPTLSGSNAMHLSVDVFLNDGTWVTGAVTQITIGTPVPGIALMYQNMSIKGVRPNMDFGGNTGTAKVQLCMED